MAAKPEPAPPPADAPAAAPTAKPAGGVVAALLPVVLAVVLAPLASWAVGQFVLLPKLAALVQPGGADADAHAASTADAAHGAAGGHGASAAKAGGPTGTYQFENVVVNLSGTMGTRYLKTTFLVSGSDPALAALFEAQRPQLLDVTLNVLSSLTLADLEEPGSKNILRERLAASYNQALGRKVAEQVYFADFVVQ